jgi:membrane fusion protein, multidrug efflux system
MKSRRKLFVTVAVVAFILVVAGFVASTSRNNQVEQTRIPSRPVAVEVMRVVKSNVTESVNAVGSIAAMQDVMVSSETAGRITGVFVKTGDVVRQGQTLVQVDDELKKVAVEQARAQAIAAETNSKKSQKDFERSEKLFTSGDIADVELEGYRLAFRSAEAQHLAALAGLRLAERQLADTRIKAPVAGVVASRLIDLGEMVAPGREIANIVDIATVKVRLSIQEEEVGKLRAGQSAVVRVDSRAGESFQGSVYSVGAKSESPSGHTYPVEILVRNRTKDPLRVGMFARATVLCASANSTLAISKEWLVSDDGDPTVFVVENSTARQRKLKLGLRGTDWYQVVDGLKEGELVVSFGQKGLKDGMQVHFKTKTGN